MMGVALVSFTCQPWHLGLGADSSLEVSIETCVHQYSLSKANAPCSKGGPLPIT